MGRAAAQTWHDGALREVPGEEIVVGRDALVAHGVLAVFPLQHAVHQQEWVPACGRGRVGGGGGGGGQKENDPSVGSGGRRRSPRPRFSPRPVWQNVHDLLDVLERLHVGPRRLDTRSGRFTLCPHHDGTTGRTDAASNACRLMLPRCHPLGCRAARQGASHHGSCRRVLNKMRVEEPIDVNDCRWPRS